MQIALVGLPGSGKTTVGKQLAKRLRVPFVDSDHELERQFGSSIMSFFEQKGESAFRDAEERTLFQIATSRGEKVISTGGGAVLRAENRKHLREYCQVVYLRSSPDDICRRLRNDNTRPLLQVEDPLAKMRELFEQRDILYQETAHFVLETGRPSVSTLVNMILMQLELAGLYCDSKLQEASTSEP